MKTNTTTHHLVTVNCDNKCNAVQVVIDENGNTDIRSDDLADILGAGESHYEDTKGMIEVKIGKYGSIFHGEPLDDQEYDTIMELIEGVEVYLDEMEPDPDLDEDRINFDDDDL